MKFTIPANAPAKPFHKHWQFCVGSGHAAMAMRTDYCEQLKQIHDELGIERVRFHGIFSDDMAAEYDTAQYETNQNRTIQTKDQLGLLVYIVVRGLSHHIEFIMFSRLW